MSIVAVASALPYANHLPGSYQIWNLYVHSLRRYERRWKCRNWGGFGVIAHFSSKVANFNPPYLHLSPP